MRPVSFLALAVLTAATVAAAAVAYVSAPQPAKIDLEGERAFPGLEAKVNAVARIEVELPDGGYAIARDEAGRWVAPDKHGYPVKAGEANGLVVDLAELELMARKTERPELYDEIRVRETSAKGAKSRLVRLLDVEGEALAALIVGKTKSGRVGRAETGTYVRKPGEARSWLAAGRLEVPDALDKWFERTVLQVPPERVRRVRLDQAEGDGALLTRASPGGGLELHGVPEGRSAAPSKVNPVAAALGSVTFQDVRPAAELDFAAPATRATFVTFDGLQVTAELVRHEDKPWLRLSAQAAESAAAEDGDESAEGDAPDPAARAQAINARVQGWAYRIPDYVAERLMRGKDALLAEEEDGTS